MRRFSRFGRVLDRLPASLRIAVTAGAEHYTATFGHFAFEDPLLEEAHPTMRRLILWHATEEIEKHVYLQGDPIQRLDGLVDGWRRVLRDEKGRL